MGIPPSLLELAGLPPMALGFLQVPFLTAELTLSVVNIAPVIKSGATRLRSYMKVKLK